MCPKAGQPQRYIFEFRIGEYLHQNFVCAQRRKPHRCLVELQLRVRIGFSAGTRWPWTSGYRRKPLNRILVSAHQRAVQPVVTNLIVLRLELAIDKGNDSLSRKEHQCTARSFENGISCTVIVT